MNEKLMKFKGFANSALLFALIFISASILTSLWLGYFWRNSIFIFVVSAIASYLIYKKFHFSLDIKPRVFALSAIMFVLCIYSVFLITPFYSASIDAGQITITRLLAEKIPLTYAPYSDVSFSYYVAYHSFVKLFSDLFPIIPDYLWYAFIGAIIAAIELLAIYLFAREFFRNEHAGEIAAILFISTRIVFQNFFWGMHPLILGMAFALLAAYMYLKRSKLAYLFFPVAIAAHIASALIAVIFVLVLLLRTGLKEAGRKLSLFVFSALLAIPSLAVPIMVYIANSLALPKTSGAATPQMLFEALRFVPLWIGIVGSAAFVIALVLIVHNRKKFFDINSKFLLKLFVLCIIIYSIMALGFVLKEAHSRFISLIVIIAIVFAAGVLAKSKIAQSRYFKIALLIICLASFFSSSLIMELQKGEEKISYDGYQFARAFYEFDPSLQKTLFLTKDSLAQAMYSNKIPFDVYAYFPRDTFGAFNDMQVIRNKAWRIMMINKTKQDYIIENKCIECINDLAREQGIKYIVIEKGYAFDSPYYAEPGIQGEIAFTYGNFVVYEAQR
ncbi:MAG: EpsG family protein [Candidatus Diapherotrites archaeon]|nr:EpsG family protein [Candidatus Diapherotrites archaeon]